MTCNFVNHEHALLSAFDAVCRAPNNWTIFEYEANSNILKPGASGSGGLEELVESFQASQVQYGFVSVDSADGKQQKVVLVHWQGEAVPAIRLANTASHAEEVRRFVKRVNCTIYARNEEDLELTMVRQKIQQLAAMSQPVKQKAAPFVPPAPVGSVYNRPAVKEELELSEREQFWKNVQREEEERRREEIKRREEQQKQYQLERKLLEKELHEMHLSAAVRAAQKDAASQPPPKPMPKPPAAVKTLVGGRAKFFDEKAEELAKSAIKTPNRPKQFKFEVPLQARNPPPPVNAGQFTSADEDFIPVVEDPARPVAKVQPMAEFTKQESVEEQQQKPEPPPPAPAEEKHGHQQELRAITLWDYQADDSSEISFDSNQLISEIEKVSDGWWRGKIGSQIGLFPANYVKLL